MNIPVCRVVCFTALLLSSFSYLVFFFSHSFFSCYLFFCICITYFFSYLCLFLSLSFLISFLLLYISFISYFFSFCYPFSFHFFFSSYSFSLIILFLFCYFFSLVTLLPSFSLLQAEQLKQVMIIASEADSKAAELLGDAFSTAGDSLIELRRLEAAEEIAGNLSRSRNVAYLPGSGQNLLLSIPP